MIFDYSKLLGKMKEMKVTQSELAPSIGISESTLNLKLNNLAKFKQPEIVAICDRLNIPYQFIGSYFFTLAV